MATSTNNCASRAALRINFGSQVVSNSHGSSPNAESDGRQVPRPTVQQGILRFSQDEGCAFDPDDFQELGEIGQGAFGVVTKNRHEPSNRMVAIKRIRATANAQEEKNILKELNLIITDEDVDDRLFIIKYFGFTFKEGDCLICMELMDSSLEYLYKTVYHKFNEVLPEEIIGQVSVSTLKALNYLKDEHKIMHRDIKPSNILVARQGKIKLCDFGISGQLIDSIAKTRDAGCRPYMAPERIDPKTNDAYGVQSDVWSFGITLIEIATGQFPYPEWNSIFDQLQAVVVGDPPVLTPDGNPRFSIHFINFVNKCLIKDYVQRPKYNKLLAHPFLKETEAKHYPVAEYIQGVLDRAALLED